jgi:hypothetical protein
MQSRAALAGLAVAAAACGACGSSSASGAAPEAPRPVASAAPVVDPGPPLDQDLPKLVERSLALYRDVAAAFDSSGRDCESAISKLHQLSGTYHNVVVANAKVMHDGRATELRTALEPHDAELSAAAGTMVNTVTMRTCTADPQFGRAMDALFAPPDDAPPAVSAGAAGATAPTGL